VSGRSGAWPNTACSGTRGRHESNKSSSSSGPLAPEAPPLGGTQLLNSLSSDPPLIAHLEAHLGPIIRGFSGDAEGVQVATFHDQPVRGAITYSTVGLSDHVLTSGTGRHTRVELVSGAYERFETAILASALLALAAELRDSHSALLRGQVIGPRGPLLDGSQIEAFYCAAPIYFADSFAELRAVVPATVFVWLVPITHAEAHFVFEHGWSKFEDLLTERDPDLLDLGRPSLI
jgi:hypothetical protein